MAQSAGTATSGRRSTRRAYSVERVFKSAKQSLRLEKHYFRGLNKVQLHALMSMLTFTARLLVQTMAGEKDARWMVRKVA